MSSCVRARLGFLPAFQPQKRYGKRERMHTSGGFVVTLDHYGRRGVFQLAGCAFNGEPVRYDVGRVIGAVGHLASSQHE